MKRLLQIIMLFLFLVGCATDDKKLDGNYIAKYIDLNYESADNHINNWDRRILGFQGDSLKIKNFPLQIFFDDNNVDTYAYELLTDTMFVFNTEKSDTFIFDKSKETFSLVSFKDLKNKQVFEKIPSYHLGAKDSLFHEYLLDASFLNGDSLVIDFNSDASIFYSKLSFGGSTHYWMVDKYEDELFLNLDGFFGAIVHISEFDANGFKGTYYGKKHREMVFKKRNLQPKFDLKLLNGNWVDANEQSEPPPKLWGDEYVNEYFEKEELIITDTTITKSFYYRTNDYQWTSNIDQDFLNLNKTNRKRHSSKSIWQIDFLSQDKLFIRRYDETGPSRRPIESIKYKRKLD